MVASLSIKIINFVTILVEFTFSLGTLIVSIIYFDFYMLNGIIVHDII